MEVLPTKRKLRTRGIDEDPLGLPSVPLGTGHTHNPGDS